MIYTKEDIANFKDSVFTYLLIDEADHILTITLNRPEKKNAMNPVMINEIAFALSYAHYNNDIWVVVIAANGDVFCAGADLKAFAGLSRPNSRGGDQDTTNSTIPEPSAEVLLGEIFTQLHKPSIAKVHASVYAGAFLIICGCTHVIAADNATFSLPEVKRGIWPMQVMQSLLDIMPPRKVLDLCMLGKTINSQEALDLGLITSKVPSNDLDNEVAGLTSKIFGNSPAAIKHGLRAFDELRAIDNDQKHAYLKKMLGEVLKTEDAREGITAFKEKRKPNWTGK